MYCRLSKINLFKTKRLGSKFVNPCRGYPFFPILSAVFYPHQEDEDADNALDYNPFYLITLFNICLYRSSLLRCTTNHFRRPCPVTTLVSTSRTSPSRTSSEATSLPTRRTSPPAVCLISLLRWNIYRHTVPLINEGSTAPSPSLIKGVQLLLN